jgi:heme-degrading monooxygenase HmoA
MAVLMIGEVPNLTEEIYAGMMSQMRPTLESAKGFIAHSGGPSPSGGWRVVEMWDTEEDGQAWFDANVKPNLPPDVVPTRTFSQLHTAFSAP